MSTINFFKNPTYYNSYQRKFTLDDLEKDKQFLEVSERFLRSVGENSDNIFEYLRDSDFNLYSGMRRAMQSGNFSEQQKQDYNYLRNRFDNADLGSLKQFFNLVKDAGIDIATDPTAIVAALVAPITGGTSLAAKQGIQQGVLKGTKIAASGSLKKEGQQSVKKAAASLGATVGAWTGLDNHFRQTTELNTDLRKLYSLPELAGSTVLGTLTGGLLGGGLQKANLFYSKMNRLYSDDNYLSVKPGSFYDKVYKTLEVGDTIKARTIGAATSILDTKAKFSPTARKLGSLMREDFKKDIGTIIRQKFDLSHGEELNKLRATYHSLFDEATAVIRKTGVIKEADEVAIIRVLRGDNPDNYDPVIGQVAKDLESLFNRIFDDAVNVGLIKEERRLQNYFPRSWNRKAIEDDRPTFENLLVKEKIVKDKDSASRLVDDMLDKQNELFSSHSILLTQAREFRNLKDNVFEDFLTTDLNTVMTYYMNAANTIQHKKSFLLPEFSRKSNVNQFIERFINPINKELKEARGGRGLSKKDKQKIIDLYKSITGQVNYFDSGLMQGLYDATKLANAMAYLPLATVSSLTEAMIPLTKTGGSVTKPVKAALEGIQEGHKIFVQDIPILLKQKYKMSDSQIQKEMNQVFLAMDEAFAETTNRLTGEGLQNEFLKKTGRAFFRFNMLIPWTKSVQLASFNVGKNLIKENLENLNTFATRGVDVINEISAEGLTRSEIRTIQKLKSEVLGLGIDIQDGLRWLNNGAKTSFSPTRKDGVLTGQIEYADPFYESIIDGAGRFVNEVIMPVGRDRARIPIFMTNPKLDIFTQFLRYPTVFSNTVLKNYINSTIVNPKVNGAKLGAFALTATSLALATNYWRSSEENRDRIASEGFGEEDIIKAFQRVGLLGPLEYGLRYGDSIEYTKNPYVSAAGLGGPVLSDIMALLLGRRGFAETLARKTPLVGTKGLMDKYFGMNPFDKLNSSAREIDKETEYLLGIRKRPEGRKYRRSYGKSYRENYFTGGPLDKNNPVEDVKEVSADRVDPLTGEPYSFVGLTETEKQMRRFGLMDNRVQLNQGSNLNMNNSESVIKKSAIAIRPLSDGRTEYTYNDGSKEIFDFGMADEPPLKSVFILPEILTLGGVRIGTKLLDFVTQTGKQIKERASVPKILFHGSQQRGLTELVPAATRSPNNPSLQRAIFTNPDKKNVIKFAGSKGSLYTVDSSSVSKLPNLFNITKNRVLNADKPDKNFLKYLDNEIMQLTRKKQRSPLAKQGEIREAKQLKDFKKDMLDKDNYITGITPAVRRALDKYNVDIVKTTPNFKNPDKVPNYIFLRDSIPIKDELLTILKDGKTYIKTN